MPGRIHPGAEAEEGCGRKSQVRRHEEQEPRHDRKKLSPMALRSLQAAQVLSPRLSFPDKLELKMVYPFLIILH